MYFTTETLQTNHRMLLIGPYRCKTMRFAGDVCTGKDFDTGPVMPPGRAKSLQNHLFYKLFWHFELVQNMKSLKIDSNFPSEWKPWNQWKNSGPPKPCCGCSAGNISDLGDHHIIIGLLVIIIIFNQCLNHEISTNIWSTVISKLSNSNWVLPSNWKFVE